MRGQRIWQDLKTEHAFDGSYDRINRFARRLKTHGPLPFRRMECAAGEQAQIDFGTGAPIVTPDGKRRRTHVLRVVLSRSRNLRPEELVDLRVGERRIIAEDLRKCIAIWHCQFSCSVLLDTMVVVSRRFLRPQQRAAATQKNALF